MGVTNMGANSGPSGQSKGQGKAPESTAYYLGQFFGHIVQAIKTDVTKPTAGPVEKPAMTVRTRVDEAVVETDKGPVTLRRTTIDEVEKG